jgi:hypothetical protein
MLLCSGEELLHIPYFQRFASGIPAFVVEAAPSPLP